MKTYPQALIGWRAWEVKDGGLFPLSYGPCWRPGVNHAYCHLGGSHPPPNQDCSCGIYAYHDAQMVTQSSEVIIGAIRARGDVQIHQDGFRAEEAQIIGLFSPHGDDRVLKQVGERYKVPTYEELELLQEAAYKLGYSAPEALRPKLAKESSRHAKKPRSTQELDWIRWPIKSAIACVLFFLVSTCLYYFTFSLGRASEFFYGVNAFLRDANTPLVFICGTVVFMTAVVSLNYHDGIARPHQKQKRVNFYGLNTLFCIFTAACAFTAAAWVQHASDYFTIKEVGAKEITTLPTTHPLPQPEEVKAPDSLQQRVRRDYYSAAPAKAYRIPSGEILAPVMSQEGLNGAWTPQSGYLLEGGDVLALPKEAFAKSGMITGPDFATQVLSSLDLRQGIFSPLFEESLEEVVIPPQLARVGERKVWLGLIPEYEAKSLQESSLRVVGVVDSVTGAVEYFQLPENSPSLKQMRARAQGKISSYVTNQDPQILLQDNEVELVFTAVNGQEVSVSVNSSAKN